MRNNQSGARGLQVWVHDNSSKTISPMRQLVAYDFWSMRRFAEYDIWPKKKSGTTFGRNCQVIVFRPNVVLDGSPHLPNVIDYLKKENHKKSLCLPDVQLIKARSINFIKLLQR